VASVYLDACCFIYLVEGEASWRSAIEARLRGLDATARILTSQLSRLECRTKPMRDGAAALLGRYDALFAANRIDVLDLTASVVDRATDLRAKYAFKAPDALHLATAIDGGSVAFWTGDAALARCVEIPVVVLSGPP
jgi:uncharacterized protein